MIAQTGVIRRSLAMLAPDTLRSWVSYYNPECPFTPGDVEHVRDVLVAQMDPMYVRQLWNGKSRPTLSRGEFERRIRTAILRAMRLGLPQAPPLSILDIGCGPGFFVAVANYFQHRCVGTDLPVAVLARTTVTAYETCMRALRCFEQRRDLTVRPYEPTAIEGQFDLIAAGLICFNEYPSGATWSRPEWEFFLTDIAGHLEIGGRLYLEFNEHREHGSLRWYDAPTRDLLRAHGDLNRNKFVYTRR